MSRKIIARFKIKDFIGVVADLIENGYLDSKELGEVLKRAVKYGLIAEGTKRKVSIFGLEGTYIFQKDGVIVKGEPLELFKAVMKRNLDIFLADFIRRKIKRKDELKLILGDEKLKKFEAEYREILKGLEW